MDIQQDNVYDNSSSSNLSMSEIKNYLSETAGGFIEKEGFKLKKSDFTFKRKNANGYEKIYFILHNYSPLNYDVSFLIEIWNSEVELIKNSLPYKQNIESFNFRSLFIPMGDFVDENDIRKGVDKWSDLTYNRLRAVFESNGNFGKPRDLTRAQISGYCLEFKNGKDLFDVASQIIDLLKSGVFALINQLSTIDGIDNFFSKHPGWSVGSLSLNNFCTELVVAKLNNKRDFDCVFHQIIDEIEKKIAEGAMNYSTRETIEKLYDFLLNKQLFN